MGAGEAILGIDLGTTFSSAAAWIGNQVHLVRDHRGDPRIPSVVHFPEQGEPIVGARADDLRSQDPENTVSGIKRILGRRHDSPEARVLGGHTAFRTSGAPNGQVIVHCRGKEYPATEVAAIILRHLRELSERTFGTPIRQAVLTVPASATPEVVQATKLAARMAGLETIATVAEPCAGALAHHIHGFKGRRKVLVYDFGGGTFDASVLEQVDGDFRVLAVGGDDSLGGDDFDLAMANLVASHVWQSHEVDITRDVVRWDAVVRTCERAKRMLSLSPSAPVRIPDAFSSGGRGHDIDLAITRSEMETRWRRFVERSMKVTAQTMMQRKLRPKDVDLVLLVGGTTYVPFVRQAVERLLGKARQDGADPETAVACGAALVAAQRVKLAA